MLSSPFPAGNHARIWSSRTMGDGPTCHRLNHETFNNRMLVLIYCHTNTARTVFYQISLYVSKNNHQTSCLSSCNWQRNIMVALTSTIDQITKRVASCCLSFHFFITKGMLLWWWKTWSRALQNFFAPWERARIVSNWLIGWPASTIRTGAERQHECYW